MWRRLVFGVLVVLLAVGTAAAQEKSYHAQRFDVDVTVEEDGSLLVTEIVIFDFTGGPFTFVFRELETDFTDGIEVLAASVDGRVLPRGEVPGQVEVSGRDPLRVEWHLEPSGDVVRTFELRYRLLGVVRQEEETDLLIYQPLPDEYEYRIESSTVTLTLPPAAEPVGALQVATGNAQWQRFDNQIVMTARDLGPNETIVLEARFAPGSLISAAPDWQQRRMAQREAGPLYIVAGVIMFAFSMLGLAMIYRRYRPETPEAPRLVYEPPSDLVPAIAGAINASGAEPTWAHALATLFDLADRGVLQIEELPEKGWFRQRDFAIKRLAEPVDLRPHERGLLAAMFDTKQGRTESVKLSELSKRLSSRQWKRYAEPLKEELTQTGLVSEARKSGRSRLIGAGIVLIFASLGALIVMAVVEDPWMLALVGSLFVAGLITAVAAASLKPLTDRGAAEAALWERFAGHLKDVTKGKAAVSGPDMFQRFLPFAAGYGLLEAWAKWFEKEGWTELPPYFHALATADDSGVAAFVAMTAASSSLGGSAAGAAGAAGAGAAGGGGSGAG
jgi:hypothetical protein